MAEPEKVRVRIRAQQVVRYDQTIALTPDDWRLFKSHALEFLAGNHGMPGALGDYLDLHDVCDAEEFDDDFEAFLVDADNKEIKPSDRYTGSYDDEEYDEDNEEEN